MYQTRAQKFKELRSAVPDTNPGERLIEQFKLSYDDAGNKELIPCGFLDVYEEIQSHADSVDIHKIVERCTMTGDTSELYKTEGFYGDLAMFPTTRAEALQMLAEAQNIWDKLPVEVKKRFDNNVDNFFSTAFSDEWTKKLEIKQDAPIKEESEVKSDE